MNGATCPICRQDLKDFLARVARVAPAAPAARVAPVARVAPPARVAPAARAGRAQPAQAAQSGVVEGQHYTKTRHMRGARGARSRRSSAPRLVVPAQARARDTESEQEAVKRVKRMIEHEEEEEKFKKELQRSILASQQDVDLQCKEDMPDDDELKRAMEESLYEDALQSSIKSSVDNEEEVNFNNALRESMDIGVWGFDENSASLTTGITASVPAMLSVMSAIPELDLNRFSEMRHRSSNSVRSSMIFFGQIF